MTTSTAALTTTGTTTFERDGRTVAVHVLATGSPGARVVVLCHAAPGSGLLDPDPAETARRDITLVAVDRPGYGGSDPVPDGAWSTVDGAADDVAAALDRLGVDGPVGAAGWSAGGRVAAALAARRPELVDRVALVATPAPHEQVPWVPAEHAAGLEALRDLPPGQVHAALVAMLSAGGDDGETDGGDPMALLGAGPSDEAALALPGARERLGAVLAAASAQGVIGVAQDIAGYSLRPWGFDPADVQAKALVVQGDADPVVGTAHGRWWQRSLASARLEVVPGAGHLVLLPLWGRVLSHLAPGSLRRG